MDKLKVVVSPGVKGGPCLDFCDHSFCAYMRCEAVRVCEICREPIGYMTVYKRDGVLRIHQQCTQREYAIPTGFVPTSINGIQPGDSIWFPRSSVDLTVNTVEANGDFVLIQWLSGSFKVYHVDSVLYVQKRSRK